ncbi:MAG TPA: bifunctional shikimate kinase/3-dehydroquinate synthase [Gaiellaceae bacterium]|nr:bifunctional shikimate kinase/3-dehydroquinate synthase [Gaiellaceae bacterium]
MGAGKSTVGREVALLTGRRFVDTDEEIVRLHGPIPALFERGEHEFRQIEERAVAEALREPEPGVLALGGGAILSEATRGLLRQRAWTVWLRVDPDVAWERVGDADRPLAQEESAFRRLYEERAPVYAETADAIAVDVEDVLLAGLAVRLVDPSAPVGVRGDALVADERVLGLHPLDLGCETYPVPAGEAAKRIDVVQRLWETLELDRGDTLVAYGGGATTDVAGFVASSYKRGVSWIAWPTTLVGQVDAAIGGKTGIDLETGKNLVGAFHYPTRVLIDPELLNTLPVEERRAGMAEVVKTGLLAGQPLWELPDEEMVRACAAFKAAVCLADPFELTGRRAILNLGHTFAHALEAASGFELRHGDAVALGLLAALRLSGLDTDVVDELLRPEPVSVDEKRAWAALRRDKKAAEGRARLVLLEEIGKPIFPVELPDEDIRRELDALIAK